MIQIPFLLKPRYSVWKLPSPILASHVPLNKVQRKARRAQMIFLCIATGCVLYLVVCKCMLCVSSQTDLCRNLLPSSVLAFCLRYLCTPTSHNRKNMLASPKILSLSRARLKEWNSCRVHSSCVPSRRPTTQK
jgi:hypothetical protein